MPLHPSIPRGRLAEIGAGPSPPPFFLSRTRTTPKKTQRQTGRQTNTTADTNTDTQKRRTDGLTDRLADAAPPPCPRGGDRTRIWPSDSSVDALLIRCRKDTERAAGVHVDGGCTHECAGHYKRLLSDRVPTQVPGLPLEGEPPYLYEITQDELCQGCQDNKRKPGLFPP